MAKQFVAGVIIILSMVSTVMAEYDGWQNSGSLYILTTPDGADLPATASENDFPLLVRLDKDWFDFKQAKPNGDDIRFSSAGKALPYQIEEWDAAKGTASIWVRIPNIKGNARQEIKMHWGKADAASESNGKAVFNESNGYLSVWHMDDPVKDEVGTLESKDSGTNSSIGMIGKSRHFPGGKGINCGEKITAFPTGSDPHSTEAWFRPEVPNTNVVAWGLEQGQSKVQMWFRSPPHINMDCYFSNGSVSSATAFPMAQWVHAVHTYKNDESRIYVNGVLAGSNLDKRGPLAIKSPSRLYIGGWYNRFDFVGDIDEVRISKVTRSADWVAMQYKNQNPLQTMVGPLVQKGNDVSVSEKNVTVMEGKTATLTAKAGGAQKVYWIIRRDGKESVAAVDRFSFTFNAGRVSGDEKLTLQFKAVYADTVKNIDIPVTITESIPDPIFTLSVPTNWDGRQTIEVLPQITNIKEMQAKGAGDLKYDWTVSGMAVVKEIKPDRLVRI